MKIETTNRGFVVARFKDGNGEACSLQKSSAAERDMIWLGVDDPNPQLFPSDGTGWHPYPLPENVQCSTRMHLTRELAAELLPLLQGFVETGGLVESPPKSGTNEDRWRHGYQDGLEVAARFMESRKVSASPFYAAELRKLAQAPGVPDGSLVTMPNGSRMYALGPCGDEEPESPPKPNSSEGA